MAPTTRRSGGSGNGLLDISSTAPGTAPDRAASGPGASAGRVYRSGRVSQQHHQIRFPHQRRVVKRYGRSESARPQVQRTLTQIGYAMPPLSDLHGHGSLDEDWDGEDSTSAVHVDQDKSCSVGTESGLSDPAPRRSKRRKTTQRGRETATPSASFHTQTLTQFVKKRTNTTTHDAAGAAGGGDDADDDDYGLAATIRDSEDEYSLESPVAKTDVSKSGQADVNSTTTPTKLRQKESGGIAKPGLSTPGARRTEIPSSQPSPFTPLLLLGRYHSPLGRQRSSPLASKGKGTAASLPELDASPSRCARTEPGPKFLKRVIPDSFSTTHSTTSQGKSPLRVLSPGEIAKRSVPHFNGNESPSVSTRDEFTSRLRSAVRNGQAVRSAHVIPDSDDDEEEVEEEEEEEDAILGPFDRESNAVLATKPDDAAKAGHARETLVSSPLSSLLSSPSSSPSVSAPNSPTPLPRKRDGLVIESSPPNRGARGHQATAPVERVSLGGGSQLGSSQADDTQMYSQAVESQRVPLEVIRAMGPQTYESDIIISTHPEQVRKITSGVKDHEFRGYRIPGTVTRLWLYSTQPACELRYMAAIDPGFRKPGEIDSQSGVGNAEFNSGQLVAKFAYKINQVYQLNNPVPLDLMKRNGWVDGPPQRYAFVPPAVVGALLGNLQRALLDREAKKDLSVSQEIEAQLLSDIADITQSSQRERHPAPVASVASMDGSTAGQPLDSPPPPRGGSGCTRNSRPESPEKPGREAPPSGADLGKARDIWPSQATTATSLASEEEEEQEEEEEEEETMSKRPTVKELSKGAARPAGICDSQSQYTSSPLEPGAVVPRPELDFEPSSIPSDKGEFGEESQPQERKQHSLEQRYGLRSSQQSPQLPQMARGPQTRRLRRQRSALRNAQASSSESTQIVLPDSLYEEVQQAPPAVILDSEDSDG